MRLLLVAAAFLVGLVAVPTRAQAAQTRHNAVINGVRLTYWTSRPIEAADVPVVFLHGGPGYNTYSFRMTAGKALDARYPMVYLDERGSGESERPWRGDYALATQVKDIDALRRELGVERMVLAGHSFGGTLAVEYAQAHPERVARLILIDAAVDLPGALESWMQTLSTQFPKAYAAAGRSDAGKALRGVPPGDRCAQARARMAFVGAGIATLPDGHAFHDRQQFHVMAAKAEQERLDAQSGLRNTGEIGAALMAPTSNFICYTVAHPERLRMPTLIVVGAHDGAVGVAPQRALARRLPDATLVVVPDSAHFPYQEQPAAFMDAVDRFMARD
ncbi:alpha/beta fold hydrolase [Frateuria sp. STR12]|uniref:alpha/beta fold hydrolase n=1 Tax=Frateuria hangzhouensis TaxID=2995589 RepID=UPI002260EB6F|nr:alpha/beta hydrolase [Frateuria sp. STR12]MCX7514717.1 alpha/beta hydrolase [Frateuria sp. STR12]